MNIETKFSPTGDQGQVLELSDLFQKNEDPPKVEESILASEEEPEENKSTVETTQVETKPTVEELKPEEKTLDETPNIYRDLLKKKIASGEFVEIEDLDIDTAEIDAEMFENIIDAQIEYKESKAKENTVKVDNLSPMMTKALEIEKNGGNVSQVFETYKNIYEDPQNPIASLDLDNPKDQEAAVYFYYKNKGLSDVAIGAIITTHKKELTLQDEATKVKEEIDTVFNQYLDNLVKTSEADKLARTEALKGYRTSISDETKKYELNDTFRKKIVDAIAKPDDKGLYQIDAIYDQWRRDPEKAVKLGMFLTNEEEYIKQLTSKQIKEVKKETFIKLKISDKGKSANNLDFNTSRTGKNEDTIDL